MPILAEFPTIMMPSQERDSLYGSILGAWVSQITRVMMSRLLVVDQWYLETLNHCRYTRIPLGNNDGSDITIRMLDILYARALSRENMVLWYSDHSRPDLGGLEEDDENVLLNSASAEELFLGSGQAKCQVNNAGMYGSGFSIDFEIRHLDIDSIIQSQFVDDIEGGFATGQNQQQTFKTGAASKTNTKENLVVLDESVMCADSFRVLKSLVNQLFTDVYTIADDGNSSASAADDLLTDFYRWLSSPHSKLYDPAMIRMIQKIMRKVFLQLLAQLRKLGAKIIFANFNRILISTEKGTRSDAKHYAEYLISTIRKNKLFSWIDITPSNYWVNLLWLNEQNHSGIRSSSNTDENDPSVTLHREWNLVSYMPRQIEEDFAKFIGEYMVMLHTTKTNMQKEPLPASTEGKKAPQDEEERFLVFNKQAVNEYLTQRLLNVVSQIQKQSELIHIDSQKLHLSVGVVDPALEFVKAFCHVFSMDPTIKEEVQIMRSNALRLVNVKDFARDAQYRNIQQTFVLPNVSCNYCSFCTDLDLCQNNRHEEEIDNLDEAQLNSSWLCKHCGDPLDRANIESRLVDYVEKKVVGYQVQDLRCIKCNSIKADNMSAKCECSGEWACKETSAAQNLNVLARIAEVENFEWLQQTLNWVLK
jgi:DNA polymerase epsilon subunit 1